MLKRGLDRLTLKFMLTLRGGDSVDNSLAVLPQLS